jgi:hypothetical protein
VSEDWIEVTKLTPGCKYRIEFDDCCVQGSFEDTFVRYVAFGEPGDDDMPSAAVFEHARVERLWANYACTEIAR